MKTHTPLRSRTHEEKEAEAKERARIAGVEYVPEPPKPSSLSRRGGKKHADKVNEVTEAPVKPKKPRSEGPSVDSLDDVFSRLIRASAGHECQFWGRDGVRCSAQMQCMHLKSRRYRSTRWRKENAACGCAAHHRFYTDHPDLFYKAVEALWPGRWDEVQAIWNAGIGPKIGKDRTELIAILRGELRAAVSKGEV